MAMKTSHVKGCDVSNCSYNQNSQCHTMAITIGEGSDPMCDTFVEMDMKGGDMSTMADVGACKMANCQFNDHLECSSDSVQIGMKGSQPDCLTFSMK